MRKTPKRSRLEIAKLQLLVEDFARQHGAHRESETWRDQFMFDTKYGRLRVIAPQSKYKEMNEDGWLTIFARFEDPERARALGSPNPHTGKWNLHGGNVAEGTTAEEVFAEWTRRMRPILRAAG